MSHPLIDHLHGAKPCGPGQWLALCPAHEDRSPSLSIRELDDGRLLLHCFAGCPVESVVAAFGLELADLFPDEPRRHRPAQRGAHRLNLSDAWHAFRWEALLCVVAAEQLARGEPLSEEDRARIIAAAGKMRGLHGAVYDRT